MGTMYTGILTTFVVSTTTYTLSNGTTKKAMDYAFADQAPQLRIITLPTGDKYNIDAGTGSNLIKGEIYQSVWHTASGKIAYYDNSPALGKTGTLTMDAGGWGSKTCTAVMKSIVPKAVLSGQSPDKLIITYGFECMTDWS